MNSRRAGVSAILFIAILFVVWASAKYLPEGSVTFPDRNVSAVTTSITLSHTRKGSEQMYSGKAPISAPCDKLGSTLSVSYGTPPSALIALETGPSEGGSCTRKSTLADFSVSFVSEQVPQISLTLDGAPLAVKIIEK